MSMMVAFCGASLLDTRTSVLPLFTQNGKTIYVDCIYNTEGSTWDVVAVYTDAGSGGSVNIDETYGAINDGSGSLVAGSGPYYRSLGPVG